MDEEFLNADSGEIEPAENGLGRDSTLVRAAQPCFGGSEALNWNQAALR